MVLFVAERVGFEPTEPLRAQHISSVLLSAAQPPLRIPLAYRIFPIASTPRVRYTLLTMFSDNVIFFDGEFTTLEPTTGRLLSLALVKPSGEYLYLELETGDAQVHPWTAEHVVPLLTAPKISDDEAREKIRAFVGDGRPFLVAKTNQFDWVFLAKLIGIQKKDEGGDIFNWRPIDFTSILFGRGVDPSTPSTVLAKEMGVDIPENFREHHALSDAQLLRALYLKFTAA